MTYRQSGPTGARPPRSSSSIYDYQFQEELTKRIKRRMLARVSASDKLQERFRLINERMRKGR